MAITVLGSLMEAEALNGDRPVTTEQVAECYRRQDPHATTELVEDVLRLLATMGDAHPVDGGWSATAREAAR